MGFTPNETAASLDAEKANAVCFVETWVGYVNIDPRGDEKLLYKIASVLKSENIEFLILGVRLLIAKEERYANYYSGCRFPDLDNLNLEDKRYKIEVVRKAEDTNFGYSIASFKLSFNDEEFATVVVDVKNKRFITYHTGYEQEKMDFMIALCLFSDFPFRDFLLRANDTFLGLRGDVQSDIQKIKQKYWKPIMGDTQPERSTNSSEWQMTNPQKHDPKKFRYIVHALSDMPPETVFADDTSKRLYQSLYKRTPLEDPAAFAQRPYIACSIMDQDRPTAWSNSGLILDVPVENIRHAYHNFSYGKIKTDSNNDYDNNLPSAKKVLADTPPNGINELSIAGTNERTGSAIRIVGGFVTTNAKGEILDKEVADNVIRFCEANSFLVVKLQEVQSRQEFRRADRFTSN